MARPTVARKNNAYFDLKQFKLYAYTYIFIFLYKSYPIMSIPACQNNWCAKIYYFNLKHLKVYTQLNISYKFYKLYSIAIPRYLKRLLPENRTYIVALTPDLQRVSFYSIIVFLY